MIIFDTETTGLPQKSKHPNMLQKQPHIIEFAGIKLDDMTMEEVDRIEFLCRPPLEILDPIITKITGITMKPIRGNEDHTRYLNDKPPFKTFFPKLQEFFLGEEIMVAHNVTFDKDMLWFETERLGKTTNFPWPKDHICTVEKTYSFRNHRLKLIQLHEELFGEGFEEAHQAMADVEALARCVIELRTRGVL